MEANDDPLPVPVQHCHAFASWQPDMRTVCLGMLCLPLFLLTAGCASSNWEGGTYREQDPLTGEWSSKAGVSTSLSKQKEVKELPRPEPARP
jgi:hypothetical protein